MTKKQDKEPKEEIKKDDVVVEEIDDSTEEVQVDPIEELQQKIDELKDENDTLKDQMLRKQADMENFRKRLIRDREEAVQYANSALVKDLLLSLDNLDRAIESANKTQDIKALIEGVELVKDNLYSTLEKSWGLKEIKAEGEEFDPELHEACMMVEDENCEKETVLQELQKGYCLHNRVIRPTKVKVGKPKV